MTERLEVQIEKQKDDEHVHLFLGKFLSDGHLPSSCHRMKTSISYWMGLVAVNRAQTCLSLLYTPSQSPD